MQPSTLASRFIETLSRGPRHRQRLASVERSVIVAGSRGKSAAVRWLYGILHSRDEAVLGKVTGDRPLVYYDGVAHEIDRSRRVTLYENETQLRRFSPVETVLLENQAIGEYTSRLVHNRFADPDVILLTNVRRDHLDQLGRDTPTIARSMARTVPDETTLVVGEQRPELRSVLADELRGSDVSIEYVTVPERARSVPGAEVVYALNPVLEAIDEPPLTAAQIEAYLDEMAVSWTRLPGGRVFNAASVNDVDSTDVIRRALAHQVTGPIQPLVYLREDRRARTVSFMDYLAELYDQDVFRVARAVGPPAEVFAKQAPFPVATHDETTESPAEVLDAALQPGWPVFIVGNTVASFMRELATEIEARRLDEDVPTTRTPESDTNQSQARTD